MEYIAGSCNIGKGEIRRRQIVALIGLILVISTTAGLIGSDSAKSARFAVFVPALVFSVGFIQSRRKFCLAFGLLGTFNFDLKIYFSIPCIFISIGILELKAKKTSRRRL